jgi:hypothetical protein
MEGNGTARSGFFHSVPPTGHPAVQSAPGLLRGFASGKINCLPWALIRLAATGTDRLGRPERKLDGSVTPRAAMMTARMTFYVFLSFNAGNPFTTFIVSMLTVMMLLSRLGDSAAGQPISPDSAWDCYFFPLTQGLLDAVFFAPATRLRRGRTYLAKTGLDAAQLPFALLGNLQRREFILNRLPADDALCFFMLHFHVLNLFFLVQRRLALRCFAEEHHPQSSPARQNGQGRSSHRPTFISILLRRAAFNVAGGRMLVLQHARLVERLAAQHFVPELFIQALGFGRLVLKRLQIHRPRQRSRPAAGLMPLVAMQRNVTRQQAGKKIGRFASDRQQLAAVDERMRSPSPL